MQFFNFNAAYNLAVLFYLMAHKTAEECFYCVNKFSYSILQLKFFDYHRKEIILSTAPLKFTNYSSFVNISGTYLCKN